MSNEKISVLLVDDHSLVRKGFRRILEDDPEIQVVGEAPDGTEAVKLAQELEPRVIVMDMAMPGLNGMQASIEILKIIAQDGDPDAEHVLGRELRAQCAGCRRQGLHSERRHGHRSGHGHQAGGGGPEGAGSRAAVLHAEADADHGKLTNREKQILQLIAEGKSNKEIAALLELSVNTVSVHRANLMEALGIHRTAELVLYAVRKGLVHIP